MASDHAAKSRNNDTSQLRAKGLAAMRSIMPGVLPAGDVDMHDGGFADELVELGLVGVFGQMWAREGLSLRDRSLVTIALLIAQNASTELKSHFVFGLNNGLTKDEIAEVIYHSAGYVGYPKAVSARTAARAVFDKDK